MKIDIKFIRALVRFQRRHLKYILIEGCGDLYALNTERIERFIGAK